MTMAQNTKYLPISPQIEAFNVAENESTNLFPNCDCIQKGYYSMVPMRLVLTLLMFLGCVTFYCVRISLSVAMVAMVGESHWPSNRTNATLNTCPELIVSRNITGINDKEIRGEFDWDSEIQGQVLGSYYYGYIFTQIPGGVLAERYSAKWMFGAGILGNAIFTLLTPIAARWSVWALVAARVIEGLLGGPVYPAMTVLISRWIPKNERSRIVTISFMGLMLGTVLANSVTGIICESTALGGWPSVFYVFGCVGCVWFVFWAVLVYETPEVHPYITEKELTSILETKDQFIYADVKVPWRSIWTSLPVWALIIAHVGHTWALYTMLTMTPTYLSNILHFELRNNGFVSSLPWLMMMVFSSTASFIADGLRSTKRLHITAIRKLMTSIAFFGPATCILAIAHIGCRTMAIVTLLCLSCGLNGLVYSGMMANHVDMSPQFAGTLFGITNCISTLSGFLAPSVIGTILKSGQTLENWRIIFIMISAVYFTFGIVYDIFGSAELQPWNYCDGIIKYEVDIKTSPSSVNGKCNSTNENENNISSVEQTLSK